MMFHGRIQITEVDGVPLPENHEWAVPIEAQIELGQLETTTFGDPFPVYHTEVTIRPGRYVFHRAGRWGSTEAIIDGLRNLPRRKTYHELAHENRLLRMVADHALGPSIVDRALNGEVVDWPSQPKEEPSALPEPPPPFDMNRAGRKRYGQ